LQGQQGTKKRIASIRNNMNSLIRTNAIGLLQHLQLLYFPSELDIDKQNTTSYLTLLLHAVSPCVTNRSTLLLFCFGFSRKSRIYFQTIQLSTHSLDNRSGKKCWLPQGRFENFSMKVSLTGERPFK
jgi:hypothetical protein